METRARLLQILGFALFVGLLVWIILPMASGLGRAAPRILDDLHAFNGNTQLPATEIQKQLSSARERKDNSYSYSERARYAATGADWLASCSQP